MKAIIWRFGIVAGIIAGVLIYQTVRIFQLSAQIDTVSKDLYNVASNLSSTTAELQAAIKSTNTSISSALAQQQVALDQKLGGVQGQVGKLSGTLGNLQKLAETDPELLKKYSRIYFLNENYVPKDLSEIPQDYVYSNTKQILIHSNVLPRLKAMIDAAAKENVKIYTSSAYRSFDEQRALKSDYRVTYGAGTANTFSADQGYSEHQLGTAIDVTTTGLNGGLDGFDSTAAYKWMLDNAYKYGFVLSYPKGNSYYVFEPWHWRYVGVKLSADIRTDRRNFYDLDQRTIDTYLINIWD